MRNVKILATGSYEPARIITSEALDEQLGLPKGWTYKKSGIRSRRYITTETASEMGARAVKAALQQAGLSFTDIDALICTSGSAEQEIPCTAALIQEALGETESGTPCFDVNSTCLSFVTGLDHLSYAIHFGRYKRVMFVATEISSVALDYEVPESSVLFGDGAVAVIVEASEDTSHIIHAHMETYSKGAHTSEIRGGGTKVHPRTYSEDTKKDFLFYMDGRSIFRLSSKLIEGFVERLFAPTGLQISDIDLVIPHQASGMAMRIMRDKLNIPSERFMDIIEDHGNMIAASIPLALHEAIKQERIKRGDKVLLIGTSAGLSLGGIIFEY